MRQWFILYTKEGHSMSLAKKLTKKGETCYVPLNIVTNKRILKLRTQPLLPHYLFVYSACENLEVLKSYRGVINILYWKDKPAVISDLEIQYLREFVQNFSNIVIENKEISTNSLTSQINFNSHNSDLIKNNSHQLDIPSLGLILKAEASIERSIVTYNNSVTQPQQLSIA
jgi:transcription antitermination factor NusG